MENKTAKAYLRYVRISPRKVQIVCDLIRGKDAGTAMAILAQTPKAASEPLLHFKIRNWYSCTCWSFTSC